jgi:hypothetical protein
MAVGSGSPGVRHTCEFLLVQADRDFFLGCGERGG